MARRRRPPATWTQMINRPGKSGVCVWGGAGSKGQLAQQTGKHRFESESVCAYDQTLRPTRPTRELDEMTRRRPVCLCVLQVPYRLRAQQCVPAATVHRSLRRAAAAAAAEQHADRVALERLGVVRALQETRGQQVAITGA